MLVDVVVVIDASFPMPRIFLKEDWQRIEGQAWIDAISRIDSMYVGEVSQFHNAPVTGGGFFRPVDWQAMA